MTNTPTKSPADIIAGLTKEAELCRSEIVELQVRIPDLEAQLGQLALAIRQGAPEAIAEAAAIRAEIARAHEAIWVAEAAERQLRAEITRETQAEQLRADKHLRRKADKAVQTLPAIAKNLDRAIKSFTENLAALQVASEPIGIVWRDNWPQKPSILYTQALNRTVGHALFVALREHNIKLPELRYSERDFTGLHRLYLEAAGRARKALLGEATDTPDMDLPDATEPNTEPLPVRKQDEPRVISDAEIAQANADGTAQDMGWPLSGREYVKARDKADAKQPVMPPEADPWTNEPI